MGKTIGIDLGTTNSVVAFKDTMVRVIQTGQNNEDLCRSCVALDKSGSIVVGNDALRNWKRYAPNIVVSAKRLMGASISDSQVQKMKKDKDMYPYGIQKLSFGTEESVAIIMGGKEYTPEKISAEILRQLKEDASVKLHDEITHAVITVPAYFNEKQKAATRKAAEMAGLKVQRLLAEPTAAAISYGADKMSKDEDKIFLVYDFGGGTFDLSILVASGGTFIESGTGGDRWLGGDDIDRLLTEYALSETEKKYKLDIHQLINELPDTKRYGFQGLLKNEVERAKKALSQVTSTTIMMSDYLESEDGDSIDIEVTITRTQFEDMIRPLVQRTLDLIDDLLEKTAYPIDTIDNILLVGGSSCIPLVRNMLSEKYGADKILSSEKPMLAIAEGAAILSHSLGTEFECPSCGKMISVGTDICPHCGRSMDGTENSVNEAEDGNVVVNVTTKHRYFVETFDDAENAKYTPIIDANVVLPHEYNRKFHTLVANQKIIELKIFTDKENNEKEITSRGFFTIPENLPAHSELSFTFRLTEDEIMSAKVKVVSTGRTTDIVLARGNTDQHCLEFLSKSFNEVANNSDISDDKREEFMQKLQKQIEDISSNKYSESDSKWQDIESTIANAKQVANTDEEREDLYVIIASILLGNFGRFIKQEDEDEMRKYIDIAKNSTSTAEKSGAYAKLEELTDKYSLFVHGYLLNIAGHDDTDPVRANKALVAFNQFMAALNGGNVKLAREILSANEYLIGNTGFPAGGGSKEIGE